MFQPPKAQLAPNLSLLQTSLGKHSRTPQKSLDDAGPGAPVTTAAKQDNTLIQISTQCAQKVTQHPSIEIESSELKSPFREYFCPDCSLPLSPDA
eukprot:scaffold430918_cov50-Prasinocladus_malaysianus.AAC.1